MQGYISQDVLKLVKKAGIDEKRMLKMRWIHVWKPVMEEGELAGQKAKSRLVILGFAALPIQMLLRTRLKPLHQPYPRLAGISSSKWQRIEIGRSAVEM